MVSVRDGVGELCVSVGGDEARLDVHILCCYFRKVGVTEHQGVEFWLVEMLKDTI